MSECNHCGNPKRPWMFHLIQAVVAGAIAGVVALATYSQPEVMSVALAITIVASFVLTKAWFPAPPEGGWCECDSQGQ
jgi:hypothetical protein